MLNSSQTDFSVSLDEIAGKITVLGIVLLLVPLLPFLVLWGWDALRPGVFDIRLIPPILLLIAAHEAVHGISWKLLAGLRWSELRFGFSWKMLSPYCHAKVPMNITAYRIGALMPLILTGIVPLIIGTLTADPMLSFISAVMISAAVGDIFVIWLLRAVPDHVRVIDHPSRVGCIIVPAEE